MSNPCINRWGLNTLWRHYWYSDTKYALNLQHDKLIIELINTYLMYGSNYSSKTFWNPFWYKKNEIPNNEDTKIHYRWTSVYHEESQETITYRFRKTRDEEIFNTRISILKFQSWLVFNLYWFQPDKKRKKRLKISRLKHHTIIHTEQSKSDSQLVKLQTAIKIFNSKTSFNTLNYNF